MNTTFKKKTGVVLFIIFAIFCGLQFVFNNALTANAEIALTASADGLVKPSNTLILHPYSYKQNFENNDPFELWTSNGTYTVNYKGITTERSSVEKKSFKIDIVFGSATYIYWKIPVKISSTGELLFNGDIFVDRTTGGAYATLGTNVAISPLTGGINIIESIKNPTTNWITQKSDLVKIGNDKALSLLPKVCPEATPEDVAIFTDKIGLFLYGKSGATISLYVDNIIITGKTPDIEEYEKYTKSTWSAFTNRVKAKIEKIKNESVELSSEQNELLTSIINRGYPTKEEYDKVNSLVEKSKEKSMVDKKSISNKSLIDKIEKMPRLFCTAYIDPGIESQVGQEGTVAKFPLAIVPQDTRKHHKEWRDKIRSYNSEIVLLGYQMTIEETTVPGPGHDQLREIKNSWVTWPNGDVPTVGTPEKKRRIFDPRNQEWKDGFIRACRATLESYPYDGLFLDQCTIFGKASPDSSVRTEMENALQETLLELRKEFPDKLFVGNSRNSWNGLNGEMIEGNRDSLVDEMQQIEGHYMPKLDLFLSILSKNDDVETVKKDMALAHSNNTFYGASVSYQHVIWFDIYNEIINGTK